jgi:hypothetical protein
VKAIPVKLIDVKTAGLMAIGRRTTDHIGGRQVFNSVRRRSPTPRVGIGFRDVMLRTTAFQP